jgi:16S rRNA (guanine527-N7)-methyltransferase
LEKNAQILTAGLRELGITPSDGLIATFDIYLRELQKWNKVHNITAITDGGEITTKHFLDSLIYLKAIPPETKDLCDVGSGGGFPGLPIAIIRRSVEVTLLEPARKKMIFLRQMRRTLNLRNIEIIQDRAEGVEERQFDIVVTRATFTISDMLKKAGHLIKPTGILIMSKGPNYEEELSGLPDSYSAYVMPVSLKIRPMTRNLIIIRRRG